MKYEFIVFWAVLWCMINNAYKFLWRNTFGRPWTYIMREHPWFLLVIFVAIVTFQILTMGPIWLVLLFDFILVLFGHIYWDTKGKYILKQRDFTNNERLQQG